MNVLLVNPRCGETFWSYGRVLRLLGKGAVLPPLGLITVAALLPEHWRLRLVDEVAREVTEEEWEFADAVLITGMSVQRAGILAAIREARRRGKRVAVGGPWAFHYPEEAFREGADIVVRGEAEPIAASLVEALEGGRSGLLLEAVAAPELETSPVPRFDLLDQRIYMDLAVQSTRGCPFQCEFCDITLMFGRRVRMKTPRQVIAELDALYRLGWRRAVFFADDNFIGSPARARELLLEIAAWQQRHGYPFDLYTQASVNLGRDRELPDLMARAGFISVFLGIETTDIASLEQTRKFQNTKVDLDAACRTINEAGLQIIAGCIIGFDGETAGADGRLIGFALRNQIPEMLVTLLQASPGTDLWSRLDAEGRLRPFEGEDQFLNQLGVPNFDPTRPLGDLLAEFSRLYMELYEPPAFMSRAYHHLERMRTRPVPKRFTPPQFHEIRGLATVVFRQGVRSRHRRHFWRYFLAAARHFPRRLRYFLIYCVRAEHFYHYRIQVAARMSELHQAAGAPTRPPAARESMPVSS